MVSCVVELSEYDVQYVPRGNIKSQALADFSVEFSSLVDEETHKGGHSIEDTSNVNNSTSRIVLEGSGDILIEQTLKFNLKASNIEAEYEALITDMVFYLEISASRLKAKSDSQIVTNQVPQSTRS